MYALNKDVDLTPPEDRKDEEIVKEKWKITKLKPWHKELCSLLAQGVDRETIAQTMDCTPTYVSMLAGQPLVQEYIKEWCTFAGLQLEAQFVKTVAAITDTLDNGNHKERMQAARLQLEATKRIGSGSNNVPESSNMSDRLVDLSQRLVGLLESQKLASNLPVVEGAFTELKEVGQSG